MIEGYKAIDIAVMLNVHRQGVSTYVKNFEEGRISKLLHRKTPPGKASYLSKKEVLKKKAWEILRMLPF